MYSGHTVPMQLAEYETVSQLCLTIVKTQNQLLGSSLIIPAINIKKKTKKTWREVKINGYM